MDCDGFEAQRNSQAVSVSWPRRERAVLGECVTGKHLKVYVGLKGPSFQNYNTHTHASTHTRTHTHKRTCARTDTETDTDIQTDTDF